MATTQAKPPAGGAKATDPVSINAIQAETIRKEMRNYRLYDTYMITPSLHKSIFLSEKPQNKDARHRRQIDEQFAQALEHTKRKPRDKYELPVVESHKMGWDSGQLLPENLTDARFYHPRRETEITKLFSYANTNREKAAKAAGK